MAEQEKVTSMPTETKWVEASFIKGLNSWAAQQKLRAAHLEGKWLGLILRRRDRGKYTMHKIEAELDQNDFSSVGYWVFRNFDFVVFVGKEGHRILKNRLPEWREIPGLKEVFA